VVVRQLVRHPTLPADRTASRVLGLPFGEVYGPVVALPAILSQKVQRTIEFSQDCADVCDSQHCNRKEFLVFMPDHNMKVSSGQDLERGISMVWVAVVLLFLIASAALAVDVSGAFGAAQTDQNTADLACLAGVKELPSETDAINTAVAYIDANWPEMVGATLTINASTATYVGTGGNSVYIDADYGGSGDTMYVRTTQVTDNSFGQAIGQDTTTVVQEAACSGQTVQTGIGMLPIGALTGPWNGDLFDCAAKVTGNCGALAPDSPGANAYRDAIENGIDGSFLKHWGNENSPDPDNFEIAIDCFADPCSVLETEPGNMTGPFRQGVTNRLSDTTGVCQPPEALWFNCDTVQQVLGSQWKTLDTAFGSRPSWFHENLYGLFTEAAANTNTNHYYLNGPGLNCDSVRLATIPIINQDLDWNIIGGAMGSFPNGRKDMKIVGFYTVYIREPDFIADIGGPLEADVLWFGPKAECTNGDVFQPFGSPVAVDAGVKLVAP